MRNALKLGAVLAMILAGWLASGMQVAQAEYWVAGCVPAPARFGNAGSATQASFYCNYPNTQLSPGKLSISAGLAVAKTAAIANLSCTLANGFTDCIGSAVLHCDGSEKKVDDGESATMCVAPKQMDLDCSLANPVSVATGNKHQSFDDWSSGGAFPLQLRRLYSADWRTLNAGNRTMFGFGWRSNFDASAKFYGGDKLSLVLPSGVEHHFWSVSNVWKPILPRVDVGVEIVTLSDIRTDVGHTLTVTSSTVEFRDTDNTFYVFSLSGLLTEIRTPQGMVQRIEYEGQYPRSVRDSLGRSLQFEYETVGSRQALVRRIRTFDGKVFDYEFIQPSTGSTSTSADPIIIRSGGWTLKSVTFPDNTPAVATDNPKQVYGYATLVGSTADGAPTLPNSYPLTNITDEKGVVYASWTYDNQGHVTNSSHIGGTDSHTFAYTALPNSVFKTTVTNPLGKVAEYNYTRSVGGNWKLQSIDGVSSLNCAASNSSFAYDSNGFRNQITDAEARVTKLVNDAKGRPTSTTDGFGTPEAITTTMQWWDTAGPLVKQIVETGKTTDLTYNTDNQIATLKETDTSVVGGQVRTSTFGYTAATQPAIPAISAPVTPLADVALTLTNPAASSGVTGWTNETGVLATFTTAPCTASACFTALNSTPLVASYQEVTLPAGENTSIDAGNRAVQASWNQNSYAVNNDPATVRVRFYDAGGNILGGGLESPESPFTWTQRNLTRPLPVGTRKIRLYMIFTGPPAPGSNDGYIDDLSMKLVTNGSASSQPYLNVVNPAFDQSFLAGWSTATGLVSSYACNGFNCATDSSTATDALQQTIDIPTGFNTQVDAGARRIELGWIENSLDTAEQIGVQAFFLDASSNQLTNGTASAIARTETNVWRKRTTTFDVPTGTRKIRLLVNMQAVPFAIQNKSFVTGFTARLIGKAALPPTVNLLTSVDGPLPGITDKMFYAYNSNGSLTSVTNEVGLITNITALTTNGLPATIVGPKLAVPLDADSVTTQTNLAYDARDRLTTVTVNPSASQAQTTLTYDAIGQITRITQADGSFLDYVWSDARRLTSVTNNTGEKIEYGYNLNGDVTSSTIKSSANVITTQMTMAYDELGRLLRSIGAATQTTTLSYDRTDLAVQVKDPRNNLYAYAYDSLQRLIHTQDQAGGEVTVTRNAQDAITSYRDDRTITTTYVRNGFGEVTQEVSPDAGTTTYVRDERGLVTSETDGRGIVTNRSYDAAGRLLTETYTPVGENVTYTYDDVLSSNKGRGKLTKITDQSGTTSYTYNALGQITKDSRVMVSKTYNTLYTYNAAGKVTGMTYPSGRVVTITRNTNGQVTGVTTKQTSTAAVVNVATGITYAPMSNLITNLNHGNGLVTTATYDQDYRLFTLTVKDGATNVSSLAYAYTDLVNLTGITDNVTAANSNTLGYSLANRLNAASGAWGTNSFSYDGVGNRLSDVTTSNNRQANYGASNNRLTSITQNAAAFRSYTYDNAGNTITETRPGESFAYTYNKRNRLSAVTRNTVAYASYGYNALEQLTTRTTTASGGPVGQVAYTYDLDGHLITEATASSGVKTREYIWLPSNDNSPVDLPLAVIDVATNTISYVHADHLGRPIRMTSPTKTTVWQASWKPWGEVQTLSGTNSNNLRYPGQYFQIETGLHYNHHRMYDPVTGRYTQPDPLRFVDGPNVYAYAKNSPFMYTDREGLTENSSPSPFFIPTPPGMQLFDWLLTPPQPSPNMCMAKPVEITVSCNVYPVAPGAICPARVSGTGVGNSSNDAFKAARRDANSKVPLGCQMRHCHPVNGNAGNSLPKLD